MNSGYITDTFLTILWNECAQLSDILDDCHCKIIVQIARLHTVAISLLSATANHTNLLYN